MLRTTNNAAWSGGLSIEDFIDVSKAGKAKGVFIQHRECGTLVEMGPANPAGLEVLGERDADIAAEHTNGTAGGGGAGTGNGNGHAHGTSAPRSIRRAVGKMKATITQRFVNPDDGIEYDVDCDCRFIFFCEKVVGVADTDVSGAWRTVYVKLFYEKDKIVPADGRSAPTITPEERKYMQQLPEGYKYLGVMQRRLGYQIDEKLPTPRNVGWPKMYTAMESWLAGKQAELTWE